MRAGDVVDGRFTLEREIASGGMGTVFRARDATTGEAVALKLLHDQGARDEGRFAREAIMLSELSHPGIVRYISHGKTPTGTLYLVMEWLSGVTLADRSRATGFSIAESIGIVAAVARALAAAHRAGLVHRDVKPQNILVDEAGAGGVKLLDFGIARLLAPGRTLTQPGAILGTPGFMAPEQARGDREIGTGADVFALGCVLYYCLTGRAPFQGDSVLAVLAETVGEDPPSVTSLRESVPSELEALVFRMLSKVPAHRPVDGAEVVQQLARVRPITDEGPRALPQGTLTTSEQRYVAVVLAAGILTHTDAASRRALGIAMRDHGTLETLPDGSVVVSPSQAGGVGDQARQAALCALAIRAIDPVARLVVTMTRALVSEQAPLGRAVDRAFAVMELTQPGEIRLDALTASVLGDTFLTRKNAEAIFLVARVDGYHAVRTVAGRTTTFVGRDRELASLGAVLDEVIREPVARVVLVTSPPGGGKSRLRREFLDAAIAREPAMTVLLAEGNALTKGAPFGLLSDALRREVGVRDDEPLALRQEKLRGRLARHMQGSDLDRALVMMGELLHAPFDDALRDDLRAARADPTRMGDAMRAAWVSFVAAEAAAHPVMLVLEDMHWGDRPSIDVIDAALRNLPASPLLVVAFARPEIRAEFPGIWAQRELLEVRLPALTKKASERLVREVLGDGVLAATVAVLVERAQGNAFYLEEMIRTVADGRSEDEVPLTVITTVQGRLEGLGADVRRVLRAASVFGKIFWQGGAHALMGGTVSTEAILGCLQVFVARELVLARASSSIGGEVEYAFATTWCVKPPTIFSPMRSARSVIASPASGWWREVSPIPSSSPSTSIAARISTARLFGTPAAPNKRATPTISRPPSGVPSAPSRAAQRATFWPSLACSWPRPTTGAASTTSHSRRSTSRFPTCRAAVRRSAAPPAIASWRSSAPICRARSAGSLKFASSRPLRRLRARTSIASHAGRSSGSAWAVKTGPARSFIA